MKKIIAGFILIFLVTIVYNIPSSLVGNIISHYTYGRLKLYNSQGSFWRGSGLFVACQNKTHRTSPIIVISWRITLGLTKFVNIDFLVGNKSIANLYINKNGANLDNLDMNLSVEQVIQLFDIIKDLGLSGDISLKSKHIFVGHGEVDITLANIASNLSPVNPLGSYDINFNLTNNNIIVKSKSNSILNLSGEGNLNSLELNAKILESKKDKLLQFISVMGVQQDDGSYNLKII